MNRNKGISILAVIALITSLFSSCLTASAAQYYTDVDDSHWAATFVNYMHEKGYIHGYPNGEYRPAQNITRAEFVTILNYITNSVTPAANKFTDNLPGAWYYNQINSAVYAGYLHGYGDGTVRPNGYITREEAATVIAQAYSVKLIEETTFDDMDQVSDWALPYVKLMKNVEMVEDATNNNFRPKDNLLRAEVAAMIYGIETGIEGGDVEVLEVILPGNVAAVDGKDGSFKFNDVIKAKNTGNQLSVVMTVVENTAGDLTITYTKDGVETTATPEELQNVVFTEAELAAAEFTFNFAAPNAGTSAKVTVKVQDSGKVVSAEKTYEFTFGTVVEPTTPPTQRPTGGITGGPASKPTPTPDTSDRARDALQQIKADSFAAIDAPVDGALTDPIDIILSNDGMDIDDTTSVQTSQAANGATELANNVDATKYADANFKKIYKDVIRYVVANSAALGAIDADDITTDNKKDYILYFRAMIEVVDTAADSAIAIFNNDAYEGADAKYAAFIVNAPNAVLDKIDAELASMPDSALKNEIKDMAVAYCLAMFTEGDADLALKQELAGMTEDMTFAKLAEVLSAYLVME